LVVQPWVGGNPKSEIRNGRAGGDSPTAAIVAVAEGFAGSARAEPERVDGRPYGHSLVAGRHDARRASITLQRSIDPLAGRWVEIRNSKWVGGRKSEIRNPKSEMCSLRGAARSSSLDRGDVELPVHRRIGPPHRGFRDAYRPSPLGTGDMGSRSITSRAV
jgi:hypothetical protein